MRHNLPMPLVDLPDESHLRVIASMPAVDPVAGAELQAAIDKLFAQFQREGRVVTWASELQAEGALLVLAWTTAPISGCSHDKLGGVVSVFAERGGRRMLDAPPMVVATRAGVRCTDRAGLRSLLAERLVDGESAVWLRSATSLGEWRRDAGQRLADSPLAMLLSR